MTGSTSAAPWRCTPCGCAAATWRSSPCCTTGRDQNRHGTVSTTADFILTADHATGLDAEALLHPWLFAGGPAAAPAGSAAQDLISGPEP